MASPGSPRGDPRRGADLKSAAESKCRAPPELERPAAPGGEPAGRPNQAAPVAAEAPPRSKADRRPRAVHFCAGLATETGTSKRETHRTRAARAAERRRREESLAGDGPSRAPSPRRDEPARPDVASRRDVGESPPSRERGAAGEERESSAVAQAAAMQAYGSLRKKSADPRPSLPGAPERLRRGDEYRNRHKQKRALN